MKKATKKTVERIELTLRVPGLEALGAELTQLAAHELKQEATRAARDTGERGLERQRLELDRERLALSRLELEQRIREWQLEKAEREARLAARGKDLGL
jgi:hypothetical protein